MELNGQAFSEEEIAEVELAAELAKGVLLDGREYTCFGLMAEVLRGTTCMGALKRDMLLALHQELSDYGGFWRDVEWFDNGALEAVLPKLQAVVMNELRQERI